MASLSKNVLARPLVAGAVGVVAGYVVLALASALVQEVWLGGVSYRHSPLYDLVLAGVVTPLCGLLGGFVVARTGRRATPGAAVILALLILAETAYLFVTGRVDGPLWFEAGAGLAIAIAVLLGAWLGTPARRPGTT